LRRNAGRANNTSVIAAAGARGKSKRRETIMAKAYWVSTYFSVSNPEALAEYAKLAGPAIAAGGGRFIARGTAAKAYEKGVIQRCVIIEFDSVEKAAAAHDGPGYQAALKVLGNAAQRDIRIVEGL
jgi:uncharacterized protein (DUF1330 family)